MTPLHGVCQVIERSLQEILGQTAEFYVLRPLDEPGLLKLPRRSLDAGVRSLMTQDELRAVLDIPLDDQEVPTARPHQRLDAWLHELRRGEPMVHRRVLWQMSEVRKRERKLSASEEQLCARVYAALKREIEMVLDLSEDEAAQVLESSETPK